MSSEYPKSRLPGPAVRMFDMEMLLDPGTDTVRGSYDGPTLVQPMVVRQRYVDASRRDR